MTSNRMTALAEVSNDRHRAVLYLFLTTNLAVREMVPQIGCQSEGFIYNIIYKYLGPNAIRERQDDHYRQQCLDNLRQSEPDRQVDSTVTQVNEDVFIVDTASQQSTSATPQSTPERVGSLDRPAGSDLISFKWRGVEIYYTPTAGLTVEESVGALLSKLGAAYA